VYWTLASLTRRCYYKIYYWDKAFTWCRRHRTKERGKQWKQQVCEAVFYIKKKLKFSADWWSIPRRPGSRERICKLQTLIKIINKSKDGWQVKAQYECNDLAGVWPWEWKRLKKSREAVSLMRRQASAERRQALLLALIINFFVVRNIAFFLLYEFTWFWSAHVSYHTSSCACILHREFTWFWISSRILRYFLFVRLNEAN